MNRYSILLVALGLLAGCATAPPPPLKADNPASPSAPEATVRPLRNALGSDDSYKEKSPDPRASRQTAAAMGPERPSFRRSARPANAEHARHANAPAAGVADSDAATAPNG